MSVIDLTGCEGLAAISSKVQQTVQAEVARVTSSLSITMSLRHFQELAKLAKVGQEHLDRKAKKENRPRPADFAERRDRAKALLLEGNIAGVVAGETGLTPSQVNGIRTQMRRKGELKG